MTDQERQTFYDLLWEYKKTIPRGAPFPQVVVDAENILWGWAWPEGHVPSNSPANVPHRGKTGQWT